MRVMCEQLTSLTSPVMGMAGGTKGRFPSSSLVRNSSLLSSSHSAYEPRSRYLQPVDYDPYISMKRKPYVGRISLLFRLPKS